MKKVFITLMLSLLLSVATHAASHVKNVLFIGDSMTGWLSERLEAYGKLNGFEVSTIVWDGSTLTKWVNTGKIPGFIKTYKPDVVFICLGLNELLVKDPGQRMSAPLAKLKTQLGSVPYVWVGPPTWPGRGDGATFNAWMAAHITGNGHYFNSQSRKLARQSAKNPHPTRAACAQWMDAIAKWLPGTDTGFPAQMTVPPAADMKRGKTFIYRRMKQPL